MAQKQPLFDIIDFDVILNYIEVDVTPNLYTEKETIYVYLDDYFTYLNRHDLLYFEDNYIDNGQLICEAYTVTEDDYFSKIEHTEIKRHLYDYICAKKIGFNRSMDVTMNSINTIMNYFKL
jgi:hypothetical protein